MKSAERSDEAILTFTLASLVFQSRFFLCELFSIGLLSFQSDFLRRVDEPIHESLGDHRVFKQFDPSLGLVYEIEGYF